ncbi:MAG: porphobilinogen synthase [Gemmatimonadota bacterium]
MRLRARPGLRSLVRETRLHPGAFVLPLFVVDGEDVRRPVSSMPGVEQLSVDQVVADARAAATAGVGGVLLFGVPDAKDAAGTAAWDAEGPVARALRALAREVPDLERWADVCLCEYTDHGHCGVLDAHAHIDLAATLPALARAAVTYAQAGATAVAPSDMLDGRVRVIRQALDGAGFPLLPIVSYAVKYASAFYGPFRDAAGSTPAFGDRRSHQMDPANTDEALREAELDLDEGADILLVKPAGAYLDVIWRVKERFGRPTAAYQVSGEYSMLKAAARAGWLDERRAALESLLAIRRAGADIVITYYAREAAAWLREEEARG